jgi:hypothetical protein|tara:strand:+ start:4499 stop:5323 length:825 start_codon:yes stop_codon:yes gene_type:complete
MAMFKELGELKQQVMGLDMATERDVWTTQKDAPIYEQGTISTKSLSHKGIWNIDKNHLSCIASKNYKIIQHKEAFGQLFDTFGRLGVKVTGRINNDGDRVVGDFLFESMVDDGQKGIKMGMRIKNSYNKTQSLSAELFAFRLICSNGMVLGRAIKGVKLRRVHLGSFDVRKEMESFITKAINSNEDLKMIVNNAMSDTLEWEYCKTILKRVIDVKKYRETIIFELSEIDKVTRWDIYNAITHLATHGENLSEFVEGWLQTQAQRILINEPLKLD